MNVKKEELEHALSQAEVEAPKTQKVLDYLKQLEEQNKADKAEKTEYRHVGIILSGKGYDQLPLTERIIYPLKIEADQDHNQIESWIKTVAKKHNANNRAVKKHGVCETINDVIHNTTYKNRKEENLKFATDPAPLLLMEMKNDLELNEQE